MIHLRLLEKKDALGMLEWLQDSEITQYFSFGNKHTLQSVESYIEQAQNNSLNLHFAIVDLNDQYLGTISLKNINYSMGQAEYAIVLRKNFIGKGYASEASELLFRKAYFELKLKKIYLTVLDSNIHAIKRYVKMGFVRQEGQFFTFEKEGKVLTQLYYEKDLEKHYRAFERIQFDQKGDDRGHLVIVEGLKDIPFEIKRIFYIYGSDTNVIRGQHANRKSQFVLINVSGTSKVLIDDGNEKTIVHLDQAHMGVYINKMVWKEMYDFSEDSVLLVLSSELYDSNEYIRNYKDFLKETQHD